MQISENNNNITNTFLYTIDASSSLSQQLLSIKSCLNQLRRLGFQWIIDYSKGESSRIIFYKSTQTLAYADDIAIIGLRFSYVAEAYQGIKQAAEILGLQIKQAKTKLVTSATKRNKSKRRRNVPK